MSTDVCERRGNADEIEEAEASPDKATDGIAGMGACANEAAEGPRPWWHMPHPAAAAAGQAALVIAVVGAEQRSAEAGLMGAVA
eukprot:CAMPEP_0202896054 /NCGR_PEP_ID=MMETSP1392-20130828/5133_1 /ASSEMBLY_ACC=CAM_ASM_000868 /TAXON_ID=225041 /ORGANISM="Chlamydomonas chlamydogama, Strain SAG 11-48b" /LENGTH=83 /DNA_ID=CAMNT_0049581279 /DNA_START=2078 /DNA_END=2330 /DNA_ORIENTATION=+